MNQDPSNNKSNRWSPKYFKGSANHRLDQRPFQMPFPLASAFQKSFNEQSRGLKIMNSCLDLSPQVFKTSAIHRLYHPIGNYLIMNQMSKSNSLNDSTENGNFFQFMTRISTNG